MSREIRVKIIYGKKVFCAFFTNESKTLCDLANEATGELVINVNTKDFTLYAIATMVAFINNTDRTSPSQCSFDEAMQNLKCANYYDVGDLFDLSGCRIVEIVESDQEHF
jgi:hypothetical protein